MNSKTLSKETRKPCRFFKQGRCAQGESCMKSHDAEDAGNESDTAIAGDSGANVNTVSEITGRDVTDKTNGKGKGKAKKPKNKPDVSAQVTALAQGLLQKAL